jgi:hypothetical protein
LFRTGYVAAEDDDAARLYLFDQVACLAVELSARKSDE